MKLLFCLCCLCFCFSSYSQRDTLKIKNWEDSVTLKNRALQEAARKKLIARRDSIVTEVSKDLKVAKGKIEDALSAFAIAATDIRQVSEKEELTPDQKSEQLGAIAERRDAALKAQLTAEQIDKLKGYIVKRKIPKKIE